MDYTTAIAALSAIESSVEEKEIHSEIYQTELKKALSLENDLLNVISTLSEQLTGLQKKKIFFQEGFSKLSKSNSLLCSSKADLRIQLCCLQNDFLKIKDAAECCDKKLQSLRQRDGGAIGNSLCVEIDHLLEQQEELKAKKKDISKERGLCLEKLEQKKTEFEPNVTFFVKLAKDYFEISELEKAIQEDTQKFQILRERVQKLEKRKAAEAKQKANAASLAASRPSKVAEGSIVDDVCRFGISKLLPFPKISGLNFTFLGENGRKRSGEAKPEPTVNSVKRRLWPERTESSLTSNWDLPSKSKFTFELPKLSARPQSNPPSSLITQDLGNIMSSSLIAQDLGNLISSSVITQDYGNVKPKRNKMEVGSSQEFSIRDDSLMNPLDCSIIDNAKVVPFAVEESPVLNTSQTPHFNKSCDMKSFNFGLDLSQDDNNTSSKFNFSFSSNGCQEDVFPF